MSAFRLLSFWPAMSTRRGTWPKLGGVQLKALYRATCMGVEGIHSCNCQHHHPAKGQKWARKGTYCPPNNMRNLHTMIIHHIRKMISRMSIRLDQDRIVINPINHLQFIILGLILARLAVDQVVEQRVSVRPQTNHMRFPLDCFILGFFCGYVCALTVVAGG